jgi:hypothetical protein
MMMIVERATGKTGVAYTGVSWWSDGGPLYSSALTACEVSPNTAAEIELAPETRMMVLKAI